MFARHTLRTLVVFRGNCRVHYVVQNQSYQYRTSSIALKWLPGVLYHFENG